ncbi:MAG: hypothetical protein RIS36_1643, partial [Pseudomonadota bacterium]
SEALLLLFEGELPAVLKKLAKLG